MALIGNQIRQYSDRVVLDSLTASATADYTLQLNSVDFVPSSAESLTVSLNGVIQKPQDSYTVNSSTLSFASALTTDDTIDFIIAERGITLQTPSSGSVGASQLAVGSINSQTAETTTASGDEFLMYDTSASALRKVTRTNLNAGAMVLLSEATASNDASIIFDSSIITDDFNTYKFIGQNLKFATDDQRAEFTLSSNNGTSYTTTGYFQVNYSGSSNDTSQTATFRVSQSTTGMKVIGTRYNQGNATGERVHFEATIHGLRDSSSWKFMTYISAFGTDAGYIGSDLGAFALKTTTAMNNVKFSAGSGNITSGKLSIYGIK